MEDKNQFEIDLRHFKVRLIEKQIVENTLKEGVEIDVQDILELKQANLSLTNKEKYAILVTPKEFSSVTKKARELSSSKEIVGNTLAKAFLVKNFGQKLVVNFYMKVNRPFIKTQVFTDREEALKWLRNELEKGKKSQ